jgi:hypothetical protein
LENPNKNVALATLQSSDPEYAVDGVKLGNQFWAVCVDATLAKSDELIRPLKKVKIIGHAATLTIAWPSTFVCYPLVKFTPLNFYYFINLILFLYWSQFFLVDFQDKLMMHGLRCLIRLRRIYNF